MLASEMAAVRTALAAAADHVFIDGSAVPIASSPTLPLALTPTPTP